MNYYLWENGNEQGPYSPHQVSRLLAERAIAGDAYWRNDQFPDWHPIMDIREPLEGDLKADIQFPAKKRNEGIWVAVVGAIAALLLLLIAGIMYRPALVKQIFGAIFGLSFSALFLAMGVGLYGLPTIIAIRTKHPYQNGITVLNVFMGWTILGWVGALVWAVSPPLRNSAPDTDAPQS